MDRGPELRETVDNRLGNTSRELEQWLASMPGDAELQEAASYISGLVTDWQRGALTSMEVLDALVKRYHETDGVVSEDTSAVLNQSTMWFGFEANISPEEDEEVFLKLMKSEQREEYYGEDF